MFSREIANIIIESETARIVEALVGSTTWRD